MRVRRPTLSRPVNAGTTVPTRAARRLALTALTALAVPLFAALLSSAATGQAQGTGAVYLLQGLPDRNIDLYSNNKLVASNVAPPRSSSVR